MKHGLSNWAQVDVAEVRLAILTDRRLLDVRRLQESSTKVTIEFTMHLFRLGRQQAEGEFSRMSALIDKTRISTLTSVLREGLTKFSMGTPLQAKSWTANASLIFPGMQVVQHAPHSTASDNNPEGAIAQDRASCIEHMVALWSIIASHALSQL